MKDNNCNGLVDEFVLEDQPIIIQILNQIQDILASILGLDSRVTELEDKVFQLEEKVDEIQSTIDNLPLGLTKQGVFPIWKRGSFASEPKLQADELPIFLIDTATNEGMSGSPVFIRTRGALLENGDTVGDGIHTRFIGVYSGRYGDDEFKAQLGRAWHRMIIDQVIDERVRGSFALR